ncbi:MAG: heavy metal translocating P-type ATPase, partial [Desulfobacterales bacterium]|nr:heavy metal translocating P-type ATPase [Desulfobacterales bacterium]
MQTEPVRSERDMLNKLDLGISGMSCASCVAKIEKGLSKVPGVVEARVNFAAEKATIEYDPAEANPSDLVGTVKELGYEARSQKVILSVLGMTCASCVNRVQTALNQMSGVIEATVNFATEKASIEYIPNLVKIKDLAKATAAIGYTLVEAKEEQLVDKEAQARQAEFRQLKSKFLTGLLLVAPLFLLVHWDKLGLSAILPFSGQANFILQLLLQTPVQFWVGWQFYKGAVAAARHRTSDMNTLIAVGTSAAYLYSIL